MTRVQQQQSSGKPPINILTDPVWKSPDRGKSLTLEQVKGEYLRFKADHGWDECQLVVGCDSQSFGRMHRHVVAVCFHYHGSGGVYWFVTRDVRVDPRGQVREQVKRDRIFKEVEHSLEVAMALRDTFGLNPTVHVDASPPERKEFTSQFSEALKGYVTGCGFPCEIKPGSWAATNVANKHTKALSRAQRKAEKLYTPKAER